MRLYVFRSISKRWCVVVLYQGRVIETYNRIRKYAISEAVEIALGH